MEENADSKWAEEYVDRLLRPESLQAPSDSCKVDELGMELPLWFDEDKFNRGREFFWDNSFSLTTAMLLGLASTFAVPSILRVLVATRRSNSQYTAYRRYLATILHVVSWFEHDLKPGSLSWQSLYAARSRHLRAGRATRLKGQGMVSQRDLALTQFGLVGLALLQPDTFGLVARRGGWEGLVHLWRVLGHMLGIEDRYNLCRDFAGARAASRLLLARVFTPCLESVPEPFYHITTVMVEGVRLVNPTVSAGAVVYLLRHVCGVPGHVWTDGQRLRLRDTLGSRLRGRPEDAGVPSCELISTPGIEGVPPGARLLRPRDYDVFGAAPEYRRLTPLDRFKLATLMLLLHLSSYTAVRCCLNLYYKLTLFCMKYFPYMAFMRYGIRASLVDIFQESPTDDSEPLPNAEYTKEREPVAWYWEWWSIIW